MSIFIIILKRRKAERRDLKPLSDPIVFPLNIQECKQSIVCDSKASNSKFHAKLRVLGKGTKDRGFCRS